MRRPLRFLAYKLDLDEKQVGELARILDELKTERAQAEVDRRRTVSALADAVAGETFDQAKAGEGAKPDFVRSGQHDVEGRGLISVHQIGNAKVAVVAVVSDDRVGDELHVGHDRGED